MARTGIYSLTKTRDTSFRNFIFVLLIVLALLVLIYLVMTFGIPASKGVGKDSIASELSGDGKTSDSTTTTPENEKTVWSNSSYPMHSEPTKTLSTSEEPKTNLTTTISTAKVFSSIDSDRTTLSSTSEIIDSSSTTISTTKKEETVMPNSHSNSITTFSTTDKPKTNLTTTISTAKVFSSIDSDRTTLSSTSEIIDASSTTISTTKKEETDMPDSHSNSIITFSTTEKPKTNLTTTISTANIFSSIDSDRTTLSSTPQIIDTSSTTISTKKKEETAMPNSHSNSITTFSTTEKPKTNSTTTISTARIFSFIDSDRTTLSSTSEIIDTSSTTISTTKKEETAMTNSDSNSITTFSMTDKPKTNLTTTISTAKVFSSIDSDRTTLSSTSEIIDTSSTTISTTKKEETVMPNSHSNSITTFSTTEKPKTNLTTTISTAKIFSSIDSDQTTLSSTSEMIDTSLTTISTTMSESSSIHSDISTTSITSEFQQSTENTSVITTKTVQQLLLPNITEPPTVKTCEDIACKKASSELLAMMNHDEDLDYCEDFYNFACGDPSIIEGVNDAYFQSTSKAIVAQTKRYSNNSKYFQIFNDFYDDCNKYKGDIIIKGALNNLNSIEQQPLTNIFVHLLLTQSMPFFDIGLGVKDTHSFEFEITLPEISSLRTSLPEWSLMDKMKQQCIRDISDQFMDNHIDIDQSMDATHDCIKNNTKSYIISFVKEMEELQALFDDKLLVTSFRNHSDGLQNLIGNIQDYLLINIDTLGREVAKHEFITLEEMNTLYKCVDWVKVFTGITRNINITGKTSVKIQFPNHIKKVLSEIENEKEIQGILNLWYNIQLFRSAGFGRSYEKTHCLKLASQLMPEIGVSLVNDVYLKQKSLLGQYERVEELFLQLKSRFNDSFSQANMTSDSVAILQNRLNEIQLRSNVSNRFDRKILSVSSYENDLDMANKSYHEKLMVLLENYRKTVFSLAGQSVEDLAEYLLLYFVDPFETEPKTFPPSRHIVFHPGFVYGMSKKLPSYVELATKGFRLGQQMAKHFVEDDFSPELGEEEKQMYMQLAESEQAEANLIRRIPYKFDNDEYYIDNSDCFGRCLNGAEMFEDNAAFRLVTDSLEDLKDKNLKILPYLDDAMSTEKYFVSFIAHELCQRQTIVDFLADLYGGRKLPPPVKMKNMVVNSNFFKKLYDCKQHPEENMNQFPYIVDAFTDTGSLGYN